MLKKPVKKSLIHLQKIASYVDQKKRTIIMKVCTDSHFGDLVWMMHSRIMNKKETGYMKGP